MGKIMVLLILMMVVVLPIWMVFHYLDKNRSSRKTKTRIDNTQRFKSLGEKMARVENKVRAAETYVTSPTFSLDRELSQLDKE